MVKVSGALTGQIMIMYHHSAVPEPLRAASRLQRLRNDINRDFRRIFGSRSVLELYERAKKHALCTHNTLYHVHHAKHHPSGATLSKLWYTGAYGARARPPAPRPRTVGRACAPPWGPDPDRGPGKRSHRGLS